MCKKMQGEREEAKADDPDDVDPVRSILMLFA
jgi:hypothetical protein